MTKTDLVMSTLVTMGQTQSMWFPIGNV